ncbi:hypothetical protein RB195_002722 [Necator americanus]|uniref:Uncharacterized protein n=1 Tax=Necator americanus TaxID=51031 RepID=A0ABR1DLS1_NECAM
MEERDIDKLFAFYDPDAAFVEIGKGGTCGKAIKQDLIKWDELQGKTTYKLVGDKYEMAGDFIIIITGLEVKSEKLDRIRVDIMNYTLTALNFVTFVWVVILYIENKCFSKKLDTHLSKRYQIQENLESTRITIVLGSLQLLFFTIHLTVNMVRRTHIGSMGTIPYRTLESVGYLFTYYSLVVSIIMGLFIRRERQTKIASLRENINKSAKGTQGSDFYFGLYSKRW